jgi:hypothetical protein
MTDMSPQVAALLEIRRDHLGQIPRSLISTAYRASRRHPVMLVLDAVTPREIDAVLDPVVADTFRDYRGVIYARSGDDSAILAGAVGASRVFASSPAFRAKLESWGIAFEDVARAEPALTRDATA